MAESRESPKMQESTESILLQIDQLQQQGYVFLEKNQLPSACQFWQQAWGLIVSLLHDGVYPSIEDLDRRFHGRQSISSWAVDYGETLRKASMSNSIYLQAGTDFYRQYLTFSKRPGDLNNQNRRRMIAENAYKADAPMEGDAIFSKYLQENPRWGWGWISWAAQYSFYPDVRWYDLKRAEQILRESLQMENLENRETVLERLRDILVKQGRTIEASAIDAGGKRRR